MAISAAGMKRLLAAASKKTGGKKKNTLVNKFKNISKSNNQAALNKFKRVKK